MQEKPNYILKLPQFRKVLSSEEFTLDMGEGPTTISVTTYPFEPFNWANKVVGNKLIANSLFDDNIIGELPFFDPVSDLSFPLKFPKLLSLGNVDSEDPAWIDLLSNGLQDYLDEKGICVWYNESRDYLQGSGNDVYSWPQWVALPMIVMDLAGPIQLANTLRPQILVPINYQGLLAGGDCLCLTLQPAWNSDFCQMASGIIAHGVDDQGLAQVYEYDAVISVKDDFRNLELNYWHFDMEGQSYVSGQLYLFQQSVNNIFPSVGITSTLINGGSYNGSTDSSQPAVAAAIASFDGIIRDFFGA